MDAVIVVVGYGVATDEVVGGAGYGDSVGVACYGVVCDGVVGGAVDVDGAVAAGY